MVLILPPLLTACFSMKPEPYPTEMPAGPVLQALRQQQERVQNIKALALIEISRLGVKRTFDTVGIVIDRQQRLRFEAYGPLGQSVTAAVWTGKEALIRKPGASAVERTGPEGLERFLGNGLNPAVLCAILSGSNPVYAEDAQVSFRCGVEQRCRLELRQGEEIREIRLRYPSAPGQEPRLLSLDLMRLGTNVLHASFDDYAEVKGVQFPRRIRIDLPDAKILVDYRDVELKASITDDIFDLSE